MTSRLGLLAAILVLSGNLLAQIPSESQPPDLSPNATGPVLATKDQLAIALAQRSLTTMAGTASVVSYRDSQMTGTLALQGDKSKTFSILIKTMGTQRVRVELTNADGTRVRVLNQGKAAIQYPDGKVRRLLMNNTLPERVSHLPIFSLLAETGDANLIAESKGSTNLADGTSVDVVALRPIPIAGISQVDLDRTTTKTLFYIDRTSGLVVKTEYVSFSETDPDATTHIETRFSDFRVVNGVQVAFHQMTFEDGQLIEDITFDSAGFNVGVSETEFVIPQEVANAK